jgi:toluene monooxygenase system ferredoxin subunit
MESDASSWTFVVALDDLWEGEMVGLRIGKEDVLVVNLGAEGVHAFDNRCPHASSRLSEGTLREGTLQCGTHLWEFDARTGDGINPRNCRLRSHAVKVEGDAVMIRFSPRPVAGADGTAKGEGEPQP